jgi:gliding motility-associated-like protein
LYWLDVKDNNQCRGRDTILVTLKECMQGLFVPSAFTPNNDGKNDDFKPLLFGNIEEYRFTVYNRWGQVVFSTTTPGQGWNGSFGGQPQNTNVFTWLCQYKLKNENFKVEKGIVTLIK